MKKLYSAVLLIGGALAVHSAQAACTYPVAPGKLPDGNVASKEEMLAGKQSVTKYDADIKLYLECIRGELTTKLAADPGASKEAKAEIERVHAQKEDAALKEVNDVVARFNEQLKAWKAKNGTEKKAS
jgi:hypothetical protein